MPLLAVDVGAGTQDVLLYREGQSPEGSAKMIVPSQTVVVAGRIDRARLGRRDVFLWGETMGGGAMTGAVMRHLKAGLKVYATSRAAMTVNDDLERVRAMGIRVVEGPDDVPERAETVETCDVDIEALKQAFGLFGLDLPGEVAVAVQDHGYAPGRSNRTARFEHMADMIRAGGRLEDFAYRTPPDCFNRMTSAKRYLEERGYGPLVMDTGPAALLGATMDPRFREPALVFNLGNGHTIGALISEGRMHSLVEHHTSMISPEKLRYLADGLLDGSLENSRVFDDGGHGAYIGEVAGRVRSVLVTGPQRQKFMGSLDHMGHVVSAAPGGDMMIAGCIGLVKGWRHQAEG